MTAARTLAIALLACITLTTAPAFADEMTAQEKRDYVSSGAYLADVTVAAAPARAWLDARSDQIAQLTAACASSGQPVGVAAKHKAKKHKAKKHHKPKHKHKKRKPKKPARKKPAAKKPAPTSSAPSASAPAAPVASPAPAPAPVPAPSGPDAATCAAVPAKPALVLDIDETAMSNYIGVPIGDPGSGSAGQAIPAAAGVDTAMPPILALYQDAIARGITVFFVTARPPQIQVTTESNLRRVGYTMWGGLSFKPESQFLASASNVPYKSGERAKIEAAGYRIIANVGDQQSDLDGGHAERAFKLPNPFYTSS